MDFVCLWRWPLILNLVIFFLCGEVEATLAFMCAEIMLEVIVCDFPELGTVKRGAGVDLVFGVEGEGGVVCAGVRILCCSCTNLALRWWSDCLGC